MFVPFDLCRFLMSVLDEGRTAVASDRGMEGGLGPGHLRP